MDTPDTREWLATNGLGGYASGTVSGANTRRYHGLLVAALEPPERRTVLLARLDDTVTVGGATYDLGTSFWASGATAPEGHRHLAGFSADPVPTWEYRVGSSRLQKRAAPVPGQNAVVIGYRLLSGPPVELAIRPLANHRDFHGQTTGWMDWHFRQEVSEDTVRIAAWDGATPWRLRWPRGATYAPNGEWYWGYRYPEEEARGLPPHEDLYCLGTLRARLLPGESLDLVAGVEPLGVVPSADALAELAASRRASLLRDAALPDRPGMAELVAAADQFVVHRASTDGPTVIAGYHWFGDWGRDTMIALPGLTLTTRRFDVARGILRTFARYLDRGMLPNRFPDDGEPPEYNTVDATLWWFRAIDAYHAATGDADLVHELYPLLADAIDWHVRGTRYGIGLDPADGLLRAGEPGVQLTWMDARVNGVEVTPRHGKPIEVNALWLNALDAMARLAPLAGADGSRYAELADRAARGMARFWSPERDHLCDTINPDGSGDARLRPNQVIALALPRRALPTAQESAALAAVERTLLTPFGLRTLAPGEPGSVGHYGGDVPARDGAYHQGTVWPWLLGPYVDAVLNVRGRSPDVVACLLDRLQPLLGHLADDACLGSVSEVLSGDPPHRPGGAAAQAWSVAELLRTYALLGEEYGSTSQQRRAPVAAR